MFAFESDEEALEAQASSIHDLDPEASCIHGRGRGQADTCTVGQPASDDEGGGIEDVVCCRATEEARRLRQWRQGEPGEGGFECCPPLFEACGRPLRELHRRSMDCREARLRMRLAHPLLEARWCC